MPFVAWFLLLLLSCVDAPANPCSLQSVLKYVDIIGFLRMPGLINPGMQVKGKCKFGYIPEETFLIRCTTVHGSPVLSSIPCQPVTCELPIDENGKPLTIENGLEASKSITYNYGDTFTPSCREGYTYQGQVLTCKANGQFDGDIGVCERVTCPPPYSIIPEGTSILNATGDKFGNMVHLKQNRGYECGRLFNLMCEANSQWTDTGNITCKYLHEPSTSPPTSETHSDIWMVAFVSGFWTGVGACALVVAGILALICYLRGRCWNSNGGTYLPMEPMAPSTVDLLVVGEEQEHQLFDANKKEELTKDGVNETVGISAVPSPFIISEESKQMDSNDMKHSGMLVKCDGAEQANKSHVWKGQ